MLSTSYGTITFTGGRLNSFASHMQMLDVGMILNAAGRYQNVIFCADTTGHHPIDCCVGLKPSAITTRHHPSQLFK